MCMPGVTFTGTRGTGMVQAGWVYRVGYWMDYTGYCPARSHNRQAEAIPAKRAPEAPGGLEWVGIAAAPPWDRPSEPCTHPSGPVGPCRALPGAGLSSSESRLLANKSEI